MEKVIKDAITKPKSRNKIYSMPTREDGVSFDDSTVNVTVDADEKFKFVYTYIMPPQIISTTFAF